MKYLIRESLNGNIIYWGEDDFPAILEEKGYHIGDIREVAKDRYIFLLQPADLYVELVSEFPWQKNKKII